jgi:hypothetical protein
MVLFFTLVNLVSAFGFAVAAVALIPRTTISRGVKVAWVITFVASALSHLTFAFMVLFYPGSRIDGVLGSWWAMSLQTAIAVGVWALLYGVYLQVGRLTSPRP